MPQTGMQWMEGLQKFEQGLERGKKKKDTVNLYLFLIRVLGGHVYLCNTDFH